MSLQLPADIESDLRMFLVDGKYENEIEVVRAALVSLRRSDDLASIKAGYEDALAGRLHSWDDIKTTIRAKYGFSEE